MWMREGGVGDEGEGGRGGGKINIIQSGIQTGITFFLDSLCRRRLLMMSMISAY